MADETSGGKAAQLTAEEVLAVLPTDASPELRAAIKAGGCIHYFLAEGQCIAGGCGDGSCCYHIVGPNIDKYQCLSFPCSKGSFSTGC